MGSSRNQEPAEPRVCRRLTTEYPAPAAGTRRHGLNAFESGLKSAMYHRGVSWLEYGVINNEMRACSNKTVNPVLDSASSLKWLRFELGICAINLPKCNPLVMTLSFSTG